MKKTALIIIVLLVLVVGGLYFYFQAENIGDPEVENEEEIVDEDNPYYAVEEVQPITERNIVMHEDFASVLEEIFGEEPKLVETGDVLALSYVVNRVIEDDDIPEIISFLEERDYRLEGTDSDADSHDLNFSAEILEQEYRGNIYVLIHTTEEGEDAQKVNVRIL